MHQVIDTSNKRTCHVEPLLLQKLLYTHRLLLVQHEDQTSVGARFVVLSQQSQQPAHLLGPINALHDLSNSERKGALYTLANYTRRWTHSNHDVTQHITASKHTCL